MAAQIAAALNEAAVSLGEIFAGAGGASAAAEELRRLCGHALPAGWCPDKQLTARALATLWLQEMHFGKPRCRPSRPDLVRIWHRLENCCAGHLDWDTRFESLVALNDADRRRRQGVYLTPRPVVDYIVNSLDPLLRAHLNLDRGIADAVTQDRLAVVDPASGTGLFLRCLAERLRDEPILSIESIRDWFVQRCLGIEIDPVSALLAQRQILRAIEGNAATNLRVAICNPLMDPETVESLLQSYFPSSEAILAIVGNPPYGNFGRTNQGPWIRSLLNSYKHGLTERKHNLDDDYIKFLRWAQHWVDRCGRGVVAMITNHGFLEGITHRQMRRSLLESFDRIYVLDLHGNGLKRETDGGRPDDNVFAIQQGVAISLMVKSGRKRPAKVYRSDLRGRRDDKLSFLSSHDWKSTCWEEVDVQTPQCFFAISSQPRVSRYNAGPMLTDLFQHYISGVQTKNDAAFVAHGRRELTKKIQPLLDGTGELVDDSRIRTYTMAPWDRRLVYYDPRLLGRSRYSTMRHMLQPNLGLVFVRQNTCHTYSHVLAVDGLISDRMFYSAHGTPYLAPLWLYEDDAVDCNLRDETCRLLLSQTRLQYVVSESYPADDHLVGPRDVLAYIYAVMHSRRYRQQNHDALKSDFARIPLAATAAQFRVLSRLGESLLQQHLSPLEEAVTEVGDSQSIPVTRGFPRYVDQSESDGVLQPAADAPAFPITQAAWELEVGGYRVLRKWIQGRRSLGLSVADFVRLRRLISILSNTIELMDTIDQEGEVAREDAKIAKEGRG